MREILDALLTREGYAVRLATTASEGLELARTVPFDAAIIDVMLPDSDGITVLEELRRIDEELPALMITAFASVENAIQAMKRGAFDYITKPFKNDEVLVVLKNATERRRLVAENRALRQNLQARAAQVRRHHRPQRPDAAGLRPDHPGGAEPDDDPHSGGERHGEGARGAGAARQLVAFGPRVHHRQLGQSPARSAGIKPLRTRQGRVYRRGLPEEGAVRARGQRDHLLRRDRQHSGRNAGQAAPRDPGARVHAARRRRDDQSGRPDHRRDERRSQTDDGRGTLPRGLATIASTSSRSRSRRCASGRRTFPFSSSTSSRSTARRTTNPGTS